MTGAATEPTPPDAPIDAGGRRLRWRVVLAGILLVAVALRVWQIRAGLPGAQMLYPDEGTVLPKSLNLITTNLNPKWFLYPSGYFMLLASTLSAAEPMLGTNPKLAFASTQSFQDDPTPYIMTGRVLSLLAGIGFVVVSYLIAREVCGRRWAVLAAALTALSPLAIRFSHYAVADMTMAFFLALGIYLLLVSVRSGAFRHVVLAAVCVGLAVTFKYNAGLFLLPLLAWALLRPGPRRVGRRIGETAIAGISTGLAFVAGTPYSVLDFPTFWRDLRLQNSIQDFGWLGYEQVRSGFVYNLHPNLTAALGVGALVLVVIGVIVGMRRHSAVDLILWPYAVGTYLYVSQWQQTADRYLLAVLAVLPAAAALGAATIADRVHSKSRWIAVTAVVGAALIQPAIGAANLMRDLARTEYRLTALPTIERLIPRGARTAVEPLSPPILGGTVARAMMRNDGRQRYYLARTEVVAPQPGFPEPELRDMCVLNRRRVLWVITSDSIESRVRAAGTDRYPQSVRYYDELARFADQRLVIPAGLGPGAKVWQVRATDLGAYCQTQRRG